MKAKTSPWLAWPLWSTAAVAAASFAQHGSEAARVIGQVREGTGTVQVR